MKSQIDPECLVQLATDELLVGIERAAGVTAAHLHEPIIDQRDIREVTDCLERGFVSTAGTLTDSFERSISRYTGARHVVSVVSGTAALHLMLLASGAGADNEVLIPALTFVATANAVLYCGATPHFIDSSPEDLGIDVDGLRKYLEQISEIRDGKCVNKTTGKIISHIIPVHVFGSIGNIQSLLEISCEFKLTVIEDSTEALGSRLDGIHAGLFGLCGALSFNGNKIITTGGGGAVLTNDDEIGRKIRTLATTAKKVHPFLYWHDELAFNYRMPSINAALGISQMEKLLDLLDAKSKLAKRYRLAFAGSEIVDFFSPENHCKPNNWLNTVILKDRFCDLRDPILESLNSAGCGCRPIWTLLHRLPHLRNFPSMKMESATRLESRLINLPSGAALGK